MASPLPENKTSPNAVRSPTAAAKGIARHITWMLLAVLTTGCAAEKPGFPTATIQGTVTIDRVPVKAGSIQLIPGSGVKGQVAQSTIADGKYEAKNVPVGKLRVMFNITRETGKMITEYSTPYPEIENLVPEQYRDGVDLTVAGNDNVPFDLTSRPDSDAKK